MSVENAKEFVKHMVRDDELREMFRGFTMEELRTATEELRKEPDPDLAHIANPRDCPNKFDI